MHQGDGASAFNGRPGIDNVVDQRTLLDKFFQVLSGLQKLALLIAGSMILVTVLLIANALRVGLGGTNGAGSAGLPADRAPHARALKDAA